MRFSLSYTLNHFALINITHTFQTKKMAQKHNEKSVSQQKMKNYHTVKNQSKKPSEIFVAICTSDLWILILPSK